MSAEENADVLVEQSNDKRPYTLGVLFVHGIGQQKRGETLVQCGDALVNWLRRWIGADQEAAEAVEVNCARLDGSAGRPAHSSLTLRVPDQQERNWLFAESWWAESFADPGFHIIASWGFRVVPWAIFSYFAAKARRPFQFLDAIGKRLIQNLAKQGISLRLLGLRLPQMLLVFSFSLLVLVAYSFVAALLTAVLLPAIVLLLLLALIPFSFIQSLVLQAQRLLSIFIGDTYTFLESPLQAASIISQVRRDLHWLAQRCSRVAVVAHSQGGEVAAYALHGELPSGLEPDRLLLVTFGSGVNLLEGLHAAQQGNQFLRAFSSLGGFLMFLFGLLLLGWVGDSGPISSYWGWTCLIGGLLYMLGTITFAITNKHDIRDAPRHIFDTAFNWHDYYASQDPVSNGPLYDIATEEQRTMRVYNRASPLVDHTTYWENLDGFVGLVARDIAHLDGLPIDELQPNDRALMNSALYWRHWRTHGLVAARVTAVLALLLILLFQWHNLGKIGEWMREILKGIPRDPLASLIDPVLHGIDLAGLHLFGGLVLALAVYLGYQLLYWTWRWWERNATRAFFRRGNPIGILGLLIFTLAGIVSINMALLACIDWSRRSGTVMGVIDAAYLQWIIVPFSLYYPLWLVVALVRGARSTIEGKRFDRLRSIGQAILDATLESLGVGIVAGLLVWPLAVILIALNVATLNVQIDRGRGLDFSASSYTLIWEVGVFLFVQFAVIQLLSSRWLALRSGDSLLTEALKVGIAGGLLVSLLAIILGALNVVILNIQIDRGRGLIFSASIDTLIFSVVALLVVLAVWLSPRLFRWLQLRGGVGGASAED